MTDKPYVFMTDSDSDLPFHYVDELEIEMVYMPYMVEGTEYLDDLGRGGNQKEYFDRMRGGAVPATSLLPEMVYIDYFEPCFEAGKDILFLSFSGKLSSTLNNLRAARETLLEKYPERKMIVVDTLSISAPQALLILRAYEMYNDGKSMEEIAAWVEENKLRAHAWFTVDDLKYLRRGGRISALSATMGTMLDLKPVIVLNKEGALVSAEKVQGRKRALRVIADKVKENIEAPETQTMMLIHADAFEEANRLADMIRERVPGIQGIDIEFVGPVIGAHCGPGTIAACFMGRERPV